jgi:hypothetical protein
MSRYDVLGDETAIGLVGWMLNAGPPFSPMDARLIAVLLEDEQARVYADESLMRSPDWDLRLDRLVSTFNSLAASLPERSSGLSESENREIGAFEKLERLDHNVEDLMDENEFEAATGQSRC